MATKSSSKFSSGIMHLFNRIASKEGNIWVTVSVILIVMLGVMGLSRLSLTGLESGASGLVTLRDSEPVTVSEGGYEFSLQLVSAKSKSCRFFRLACSSDAAAQVRVEPFSGQPSQIVWVQVGRPVQVTTLPGISLTATSISKNGVSIQITAPAVQPVAQSPVVTPNPSGGVTTQGSGTILSPNAQSSWSVASLQTIRWNKDLIKSAGLGVYLLKGGVKVRELAWPKTVRNPNGTYSTSGGMLRNNGAFDCVIPSDVEPGTYQIRLVDGGGVALATSSEFVITAKSNSVTIKNPTNAEAVPYGQDYLIRWLPPKFSSNIDVAVYNEDLGYNGLGFIAKNIPEQWIYVDREGYGGYTWSVFDGVLPQANGNAPTTVVGENTWVIITATDRSKSVMVKVRVVK